MRVGPRRIEIDDRVEGGAGQAVRARLLLAPGLRVEPDADGARIRGEGVDVTLRTTAALTVVPAPWYPDFGVEVETRQVVLDYGVAPCAGRFILVAE